MKKLIITALFIAASSVAGFCQFSEEGYKDFKLGMNVKDAQKLVTFKLDDMNRARIKYDGINLVLEFKKSGNTHILDYIISTSAKAKVEGIPNELIGKSLKQVKAVLGDKMVSKGSEYEEEYYIYYRNNEAKKNDKTMCLLTFANGKLTDIRAWPNLKY